VSGSKRRKIRHRRINNVLVSPDQAGFILDVPREQIKQWMAVIPTMWFTGPENKFLTSKRIQRHILDGGKCGSSKEEALDRLIAVINQ